MRGEGFEWDVFLSLSRDKANTWEPGGGGTDGGTTEIEEERGEVDDLKKWELERLRKRKREGVA